MAFQSSELCFQSSLLRPHGDSPAAKSAGAEGGVHVSPSQVPCHADQLSHSFVCSLLPFRTHCSVQFCLCTQRLAIDLCSMTRGERVYHLINDHNDTQRHSTTHNDTQRHQPTKQRHQQTNLHTHKTKAQQHTHTATSQQQHRGGEQRREKGSREMNRDRDEEIKMKGDKNEETKREKRDEWRERHFELHKINCGLLQK